MQTTASYVSYHISLK